MLKVWIHAQKCKYIETKWQKENYFKKENSKLISKNMLKFRVVV